MQWILTWLSTYISTTSYSLALNSSIQSFIVYTLHTVYLNVSQKWLGETEALQNRGEMATFQGRLGQQASLTARIQNNSNPTSALNSNHNN